ncbi:16S rRNA (uracil(1498)-N(3))-methyltransferase [Paramicrobacterium chengjingii]|uniref:Ribosomal RNA small subunit methyltransferase E n=1 Tax=Paramicrobacterium chengjingii TaxID=2769067 RepID=A0ABX6YMS6_9MICO|nr:16S rRNA (uracil(1498)-N(3))-methyltransferase [Microbacterium chengjingii]QPZ40094.1 16S rRNA (uracil(1498)-N(3))-methyltransferase [Microbacterium chengjingii]
MSSLFLDDALDYASPGDHLVLSGPEAKHAVSVSRVRPGESVLIGNGRGLLVECVVEAARPHDVELRASRVRRYDGRRPSITLAQALAKGDRDERAVQMCTELGVSSIIPWQAKRSVSRWDAAKAVKGALRWQTIAREATKQSLRSHIPDVESLVTTTMLATRSSEHRMLVLDPQAETALSSIQLDARSLILVVGPEGGIADEEHQELTAANAERVRLGSDVLRTSSAGAAALAVLNVLTGHW